jgi:hypothetical protein
MDEQEDIDICDDGCGHTRSAHLDDGVCVICGRGIPDWPPCAPTSWRTR